MTGYRYIVVEPQMTVVEKQIYAKITRLLVDELEVDMNRLKNSKIAQAYLFEETKKRKLLIGKGGLKGNVVRISPPLNVSAAEIKEAIQILEQSFAAMR